MGLVVMAMMAMMVMWVGSDAMQGNERVYNHAICSRERLGLLLSLSVSVNRTAKGDDADGDNDE
jgi:hypothetical protein